ncbi:selenocysteine-specific elongation factor [Scopulibacillus darangshiensis]|uniref:Selenocysteine-specific elongation factor n=1 Tax=Scopulibacillus darangshiensis TaxID=442528 RepID=A0A4R2P7L2_9BACL|nr:selenocysteine-specific translation elongation factor [Scopulibacillus darangshiensis]TCP30184.1 selenocysteine-specific elongation factor [Scopulibacillus darangshiensis]
MANTIGEIDMLKHDMTIGLAGHIDHGKTSLTKALTDIETDRLKEEQTRNISIENGFAYLDLEDQRRAAIIDVPGHERFIRQMIAGVAGIDLVILVIAADEGVMPQTEEHIDILTLLGIKQALIVLTKIGVVDDEWLAMVEEDVSSYLKKTSFADAPIYKVDSVSGKGIALLKDAINAASHEIRAKNPNEPFRMPIDDVFTLHGLGTIVRGTIFNGQVHKDDNLMLLPKGQKVKVKSLQIHHKDTSIASSGQRAAMNIGGLSRDDVKRGDVLVSDGTIYMPSSRLDVQLKILNNIDRPFKQRSPVICHLGTAAVMGKLIMFDRNKCEAGDDLYCQIELAAPLTAKKGDRFIVRRPTPAETIGGGQVIDVEAVKHRFGEGTIKLLERKAQGAPADLVYQYLVEFEEATERDLLRSTGLPNDLLIQILNDTLERRVIARLSHNTYVLNDRLNQAQGLLLENLKAYHQDYPMRQGLSKADLLRSLPFGEALQSKVYERLKESNELESHDHMVKLSDFTPHFPDQWARRMTGVVNDLAKQGLKPVSWSELADESGIPAGLQKDLKDYLLSVGKTMLLEEDLLMHHQAFCDAVKRLRQKSNEAFTIQDAKAVLDLSRKYLIPFLECCDREGYTVRENNKRRWK